VRNEGLHEEIVQQLGFAFFDAVEAGRIWSGTKLVKSKRTRKEKVVACVDCWMSRVHKRIARRLALPEAREFLHRAVPPSGEDGHDDSPFLPYAGAVSTASSAEEIVYARELLSAVETHLDHLPARDKEIFRRHILGDSYREIAEALCVTEPFARTSVHRTLIKILREIDKDRGRRCPFIPRKATGSRQTAGTEVATQAT
jgi:hypothetical protein